jgi:Flagellar hook-length control protein FliK
MPQQPTATATAVDPNAEAVPGPAASNSVPGEFRSIRARSLASTLMPSGTKPSAGAQIPFFATPTPVPIPIALPKFKADSGSGPQERTATSPRTEDAAPVERAAVNDAALEVRIKAPEHEDNPKPAATNVDPGPAVPVTPTPSEPVTLKPLPELPTAAPALQAVSAVAVNPVHAVPAEVTVRTPETPAHPQTQSAPSTARSSDIEEAIPARDVQQPLKSVSLEFSPDGAGDVRLRLSEKSGEIHISLHSADASLSSRLHEGVHDLVGSLSSAGYEAEAWTPGQGHQNNQREPEQRKNRRADSKEAGEAFGDVFQQPIQEIA